MTDIAINFDLDNLPDEVLFYKNNDFFRFVETCLGSDELELIKVQGIKNTRGLVHIHDVLTVIDLDCDEINELKKRICFHTKNNGFVIKEGFKCGVQDFIHLLKTKSTDYLKRSKKFKSSSKFLSQNTFNPIISSADTHNQSSSILPLTTALTTVITLDSTSSIVYEKWISDSIDNYCKKEFDNIILLNNVDYTIKFTQSAVDTHTQIKCNCGSIITLNYRPEKSSFQLSAFYKHVKHSHCLMMKTKKNDLKKINKNIVDSSNESQEQNEEQRNYVTDYNDGASDYNDDDVSDVVTPSKSGVDNGIRQILDRSTDFTEGTLNLNKRRQPSSNKSSSLGNNKKSRRS